MNLLIIQSCFHNGFKNNICRLVRLDGVDEVKRSEGTQSSFFVNFCPVGKSRYDSNAPSKFKLFWHWNQN